MSSQDPPSGGPSVPKPEDASTSESTPLLAETNDSTADASMDTTPDQPPEETWEDIPDDVRNAGAEEIGTRARLIDNDIRVCSARRSDLDSQAERDWLIQVMRSEMQRLQHEQAAMQEKIRDNGEKIKQNKVLPYLVGNVVEVCREHLWELDDNRSMNRRFWMWTRTEKRMVVTKTLIPCEKGNVQ